MKIIYSLTCFGLFLNSFAELNAIDYDSTELMIFLPSGEQLVLNVMPQETFREVMNQASNLVGCDETSTYLLDYSQSNKPRLSAKSSTGSHRNYHAAVTTKEKKDIHYIVTTLGRADPIKLKREESFLTQAGDRINHLHPFKFLSCIFTNEEMKVGLLQIRSRIISRIPKKFFGGLFESLTEEAEKNNLHEYINDFAYALKVDPALITTAIEKKEWKELINILIEQLPRNGNPNRYDM